MYSVPGGHGAHFGVGIVIGLAQILSVVLASQAAAVLAGLAGWVIAITCAVHGFKIATLTAPTWPPIIRFGSQPTAPLDL